MHDSPRTGRWNVIGIDIGGANLKIVTGEGVAIHYCPLWKEAPLRDILEPYRDSGPAAVVMSGELADSFSSKREGVEWIVSQVSDIFPDARYYGTDGTFHREPSDHLAAANWYAMADYFQGIEPDALLVDMGSTTTDIIPLNAFRTLAGETDLTRLQHGYLIYLGSLRTPVSSLIRAVRLQSGDTPVSTEFFACSGDVHVVLESLPPDRYTTPTPDGRDTGPDCCLQRLARVVCADLPEIGTAGAMEIAYAYFREEEKIITTTISEIKKRHHLSTVLCAGIGSSILASWTGGRDLAQELGEMADALPAFAVREVAVRDGIF